MRLAPLHSCGRFQREAGTAKGTEGASRGAEAEPRQSSRRIANSRWSCHLPSMQQIVAGVALLLKAGAQQQRAARHVGRQAGGLDPVQAQPVEGEIEDQRQRRGHIALAGERLADPVAEARRLGDAAPHIGQADAADQRLVVGGR